MANKYRAEVEIELGGKRRLLRLTFNSLVEMEEAAGASAFEIMERIAKGRVPARIVAAIVWAGIRGPMDQKERLRAPSLEDVGEWLFEDGMVKYLPSLMKLLSYAITTPEQSAKAAEDDGGPEGNGTGQDVPAASTGTDSSPA